MYTPVVNVETVLSRPVFDPWPEVIVLTRGVGGECTG